MKLFISHAWEDKDSFVAALAERLKKEGFDVWYDDYVLKMGMSLFEEINKGLRECDYGIVVLSPAFFAKKWTKAELDGLFSLQTENRKIILPIWKDVGFEEVRSFSPILADTVAARTASGLDAVVERIKQTIGFTETVASFDPLVAAKAQLLAVNEKTVQYKAAKQLAESTDGIQLAMQTGVAVCQLIADTFTEFQKEITEYQFQIQRSKPNIVEVHTRYYLSLHVVYDGIYTNTVRGAKLRTLLYKRQDWPKGNEMETQYSCSEYHPWFMPDKQVVWRKGKETGVTNEQLVGLVVKEFVEKFAELDQQFINSQE